MTEFLNRVEAFLTVFSRKVSTLALILGGIALVLLAVPVTLDIGMRHLGLHVPGAFEIQELMMGVLTVCGMIVVADRSKHIAIDFFFEKFPSAVQEFLSLLFEGLGLVFYSLLGWQIIVLALEKFELGETTPILYIPLGIPIMVFGICLFLFSAIILKGAVRKIVDLIGRGQAWQLLLIVAVGVVVAALPWLIDAAGIRPSRTMLGVLGILFFMGVLFIGCPLGYAMGICGFLGLLCLRPDVGAHFSTLSGTSYAAAFSSTLAVVPLFCLMGELSLISGISADMFQSASIWMGRTPASLGMASIAGCAGFAAICGDSLATGVTMASVALPEMRKKGYDPAFACATLACGGTLGVLIPPSLSFIIYAIITESSTGKLFVAGVVPGLMLSAMFLGVLFFTAHRHPEIMPCGQKHTMLEKFVSLKGILAILFLIVIIMGGILAGFFSATEAGAIGSVAVWLFSLFMRRINWEQTKRCLINTVFIAGKLMFILMSVSLLGVFIAYTRLTENMANAVTSMEVNRYVILVIIIGFYVLMGCMMNVLPLLLLTLPTIYPTVVALGFDVIWFGVLVVILTEMAVITPPVGINVFGISSMAQDVPIAAIFKNVWKFFGCMALLIFLIILFPELALWLPRLVFAG